ncbi:MAG TPA: hypothetical protein VIL63_09055 [Terriglobales bacterium]
MSDATEKTFDFIKDLGDAARRNPVSTALIGTGLLWLFTGGKSVGRAGDLFRSARLNRLPDTAKDALGNVGSGLGAGAESVRDIASSTLSTVREGAGSTLDQASDFAQSMREGDAFQAARENLAELFRAQPLALGAIGLAIGAGIAAALPGTDVENSYLGEVSETVKSKTAEIAGQQVDKAVTRATDAMDAAADEARRQGLTVDGARAAVADVTDRAGRVVDAAKKVPPRVQG